MEFLRASKYDLPKILELQKDCYLIEATLYNDFSISPLHQTIESIEQEFNNGHVFLKLVHDEKIIGSIRAYEENDTCYIGKLIVDIQYQNRGLGQELLRSIEQEFLLCDRFELYTGFKSEKNLYLYKKLGYKEFERVEVNDKLTFIFLEKNTSIF